MSVTYKAILIGNSTFPEDPHGLQDLIGPPNDVKLLKKALSDKKKGLFKQENILTLINATTRDILKGLEQFYKTARRTDQLLFFYSGHGCKDDMDRLYLCGKDSIHDSLLSTAIPGGLIQSMLDNSSSKKNIIILDCCNSGNFKSGDLPQNLQGEGRYVITSSHANQLSSDTTLKNKPSPFTKYLVEALLHDEIDTNQDGYVGINEVYEFIFPKLYEETKQRPQRKFGDTVGDLPLCKRAIKLVESQTETNATKTINLGHGIPKLNVSEQKIEHDAVAFDEELPKEIIDVFNEGAGLLDWEATTESDWVEIENHDTYFTIKFTPKVGINRGSVRIRDKNGGGAKTIRLKVERLAQEQEIVELEESQTQSQTRNESILLASFQEVNLRWPANLKATIDNSEQKGLLRAFSDRIEYMSNVGLYTITEIQGITYLSQDQNPGFPFNYVQIDGICNGELTSFCFYSFSWWESGNTLKMFNQLQSLANSNKLKVKESNSFYQQTTQPSGQEQNQLFLIGSWKINVSQNNMIISTLQLDFKQNMQVVGTQQSNQGFSQISGVWAYDSVNKVIGYQVSVNLNGFISQDVGAIKLLVDSQTHIKGFDANNWLWEFVKA